MLKTTPSRLLLALTLLALSLNALAAPPTPQEFLGYPVGSRFTPQERILAYFQALASASPLVTVQQIGESWEGRPLVLSVITSEKNRASLDQIRADVAALNRPDTTTASAAEELARKTPAIVWLAFGVHGNESSSSEAAMLVASRLLQDDEEARRILDQTVVIIDPLQNPDGRERYVQWYRQAVGQRPSVSPDANEQREPWPGGRTNHYLVDMNRDWAWATQRETAARIDAYRQWNPQLFVDFHEMGYQSSYFFPPDAHPINANIAGDIQKWLELFGKANAEAFAAHGWPFFTHEVFDLFYPAYGDSWPSLRGGIGMTYEVAGQTGLAVGREDGTLLTLKGRAERHFTTAMATLSAAAANRQALVRRSYDALAEHYASAGTTYLVLPDSPNLPAAVALLQRQGIELGRLAAPAKLRATSIETDAAETRDFPAGALVVRAHQPLGALVESLFERTPKFSSDFLEQQKKRVAADQDDEFYDMTAWALPFSMNLATWAVKTPLDAKVEPWAPAPKAAAPAPARFGYLIDGLDPQVYRAAGMMLARNVRFSVSEVELPLTGRTFARGTLLVERTNNGDDLAAAVAGVAAQTGAEVVPVDSPWGSGISLGSEKLHFVRDPKIAILTGPGTSASSAGSIWYTLDVDVPIPFTAINTERLGSVNLARYRVLVIPDGDFGSRIGKGTVEKLQAWVKSGGTIVAVKGGAGFLRSKDVGISKVKTWPGKKSDDEEETAERYNDYRVPGAAFRTAMNERSFLTFGLRRTPTVVIEGPTALMPVSHAVDNVVTIVDKDALASGFAWPESVERLRNSPYLVTERLDKGLVITFAEQPFFRLFWRATLPLFLNSVLYSPSFNGE